MKSRKSGPKGKPPAGRAYARLTRHERNQIERMLDRGRSCREIARELDRSPSTVANEVSSHRFYTSPRSKGGQRVLPGDEIALACPRLGSWPRCCNGCKRRRGYGCNLKPRAFYSASRAQRAADSERSSSRRGIDETEASTAEKLAKIRDGLGRGLSPQQMAAANGGDVDLSASTIYRWVDEGYDGMTNMELRRKVGYRPRKHSGPRRPTRHSDRRAYSEFERLGEDVRASAWEMDTVEGRKADTKRLLTLLHRPSRFQLALPIADGTPEAVRAGLGLVRDAIGEEGMRRVFGALLTDNGSEFSDEDGIAGLIGERGGETRLYYCDSRQSQQKGACERNHVEIRKMLPKGQGLAFDLLGPADAALVMSHVNSEPRGCLGFLTPAEAFEAMLGDDARAIMDAFGVERVPRAELDLTYGAVARAREERGEAPLA